LTWLLVVVHLPFDSQYPFWLFALLSASVQVSDELDRVKQEIEERGSSMADRGNV